MIEVEVRVLLMAVLELAGAAGIDVATDNHGRLVVTANNAFGVGGTVRLNEPLPCNTMAMTQPAATAFFMLEAITARCNLQLNRTIVPATPES